MNPKALTLKDYITMPLLELVDRPDFDSEFFWIAAALYYDIPMVKLVERVDGQWVKSSTQ